jgi:hypothetical protein
MQSSISPKRNGGKAHPAAPYLEVMTVRCSEQAVQREDGKDCIFATDSSSAVR